MTNKRSFSQVFQTPAKSIIEPNQHATGTALGKIALRTLSYIKHAQSLVFGRITVGCVILVVSLPIPW